MMLHFTIHSRRQGKCLTERILTPARYLRLRREASRYTVDQVATLITPSHADRPATAALIRMLETDGSTSRRRDIIERLAAVFPLDPEVYYQLVVEPVDRLPRICLGCGCSQDDACVGPDGACGWSTPSSCTRCVGDDIATAEAA